jgi:hypothetical protein
VRSSSSCFNFQYLLFSLRSSSSCLRLLPRVTFISSLCLSFNNVILECSSYTRCDQSSQPSSFLMFAGYSCPLWLFVTLLYFSHDRFSWSSSFSSSTFHHFFWYFWSFRSVQVSAVLQM